MNGYCDKLAAFVDNMVEQGFVRPAHAALLNLDASPEALVQRLRQALPKAG